MRKLDRKLLRDVFRMRSQVAAIAAVVAAGVATYVTMNGAYQGLKQGQTAYYASHRFADVFAGVKRAPAVVLDRIRDVPGVTTANGRIVADVTLDVGGLDEPAIGRLVSIPKSPDALNRIYIRRGRMIADVAAGDLARSHAADDEVIAGERFCAANALEVGDTVRAVINGHWKVLRIVGIGSSPEFINEVSSLTTFPDYKRFGVFWMGHEALASAFAMQGAYNDFVIALAPGADERDVINRIDHLLEPYGGIGAYGREDQVSHRILRDELTQDRVTARVMPVVFALVAAFLIHMVLTRLVASQRDQIAILKAFGYSNAPIVWHFLKFAVAIVLAGSAVGVPLGIVLGGQLAKLYRDFFSMPELRFVASPATLMPAPLGGIVVAIGATIVAVRLAVGITPAEGMRGEQPAAFHATAMDRFHRVFSSAGRMVLRSVERRPLRATLSVIAIAASVMILVAGRFAVDALDNLIEIQFRTAQRDDVTITFVEPVANSVQYELARLPGVRKVETFRATPARIRFGHRSRRIALMGLARGSEMQRLIDVDRNTTAIAPDGVVLTGKLARILGVRRGDDVSFETLEGRRTTMHFPVVGIVDELMGISAYVDRDLLQRKLGDGGTLSGAHVSVDPAFAPQLNRALKRLPAVGAAAYREIMLRSFRETFAKNMLISMTAMVFFACVIAFGVIYNNARIALSERGRDLASLRVLGFTHREVGALLLVEQALLTLVAIPLGFVLGRLVALGFVRLFDTEGYRLPGTVSAYTYAFSFLIVVAATAFSGALVWRRVGKLDLVAVLKTRE